MITKPLPLLSLLLLLLLRQLPSWLELLLLLLLLLFCCWCSSFYHCCCRCCCCRCCCCRCCCYRCCCHRCCYRCCSYRCCCYRCCCYRCCHPLRMSSLTRLSQDRWEIFSINRLRRVLGNKTIGLNSFDEQQTNNFWVNYTIFTFLPTTCYRGSLAHKLEASVILDPSLNYRHPKTRDYITWFILRGSTSLFVFGWQDEADISDVQCKQLK